MSQSHRDSNESKQAWEDRLSESALREVVGREQPPDLTERIVAAVAAEGAEKMAEHKKTTMQPLSRSETPARMSIVRRRLTWLLATAAMLLVTTLLLLPATQTALFSMRPDNVANIAQDSSGEDTYVRASDVYDPAGAAIAGEDTKRRGGELMEAQSDGYPADRGRSTKTTELARSPVVPSVAGKPTPWARPLSSAGPRMEGRMDGAPVTLETAGARPGTGIGDSLQMPSRPTQARELGRFEGEQYARLRTRLEHALAREMYNKDETTASQDGVSREARIEQLIRREMKARSRGDRYAHVQDNPFLATKGAAAVSTFSIDVDTASYTNVRQYLMHSHQLPPPGAVRIEEMINYFDYSYEGPDGNSPAPFAAHIELARCPWKSNNLLARVALKGREIDSRERPVSNLVFLVDVSGSMNQPNKLPLVVDGLRQLTHELGENDRVAIVVYASAEGLALRSTLGTDQDAILGVLDRLNAGGSTAGGAGIELAYKIAQENFVEGGVNRVILCTDGDFNVGVSDTAGLQRLAERKAQEANVFLTVLGYGRGNLNDEMMETISNKGNGNYHYIDNSREARKVLIEQMSGTLVTIAKDVKIQIEFNPSHVAAYRLIGYENRVMAREDFDDDKKDAGEIGAGHSVTALYELVPTGVVAEGGGNEPLKYQDTPAAQPQDQPADADDERFNDEMFTLRLRYKKPEEDKSTKIEFVAKMNGTEMPKASDDFQFAAAVASFGMLLRNSAHSGDATVESVLELAAAGRRNDPHGYRSEFVDMVRAAQQLWGR